LYTQVHAVCPKLFPTQKQFGLRYCDGQFTRYGWEYKGPTNIDELHLILKKYVMIRRLKASVLRELPAKRRQAIIMDIPKKSGKVVRSVENLAQMLSEVVNGKSTHDPTLMQLYEQTGIAKIDRVVEYLSDLIENQIKFLVFCHHQKVLNGISEGLSKLKVQFIRIEGKTTAEKRQEAVNRFQSDSACQVALISITAGGTGLTLTAASTVVFAELYWTPGMLIQAEDRVHRIGQHNSVNIHYILGKNTLDDELWPLIRRKLEVLGSTLDGKEEQLCIEPSIGNTDSSTPGQYYPNPDEEERYGQEQVYYGDMDDAALFDSCFPSSEALLAR